MKVRELSTLLRDYDQEADVIVWLPGSRIDVIGVIGGRADTVGLVYKEIWIEGDLRSGSALLGRNNAP